MVWHRGVFWIERIGVSCKSSRIGERGPLSNPEGSREERATLHNMRTASSKALRKRVPGLECDVETQFGIELGFELALAKE